MQLDDLIEAYTIDNIAKRTNITAEVISKLFDKEFKALKKTQALGAISIIEREYDVDLSALRQECRAYFGGEDALEGGLTVLKPIDKEKRLMSKFFSLALLVLLACAAWYFFTEYYDQKIEPFESQSIKPIEEGVSQQKGLVSEEKNGSADNKKMAAESVSVAPDVEQQIEGIEASIRDIIEENEENKSETPKETGKQSSDEQTADAQTIEKQPASEQSVESASEPGTEINQSAATEVLPSASAKKEQNETVVVPEAQNEAEQDDAMQAPAVLKRESITLLPMHRMWFRLINYDTKKVRTFKRKDRYKIDLREHAWLLATENARFAIIDGDLFEEYQSKGKLFFLLDQDGVHQLSEAGYRAVEK